MKPLYQVYLAIGIVLGVAAIVAGMGFGIVWLDAHANQNRVNTIKSLRH